MRIILSRKGFDSKNGGCPSPILPDGTLLSLPIPLENNNVKFSELFYKNKSYFQIIKELHSKTEIQEHWTCHLDPDIRNLMIEKDWVPLFGQEGGPQTHLKTKHVCKGDIFLFFGWFKQTTIEDGALKYLPGAPDQHIIYGYLQIGEKYTAYDSLPPEYRYHPHATKSSFEKKTENCIYKAAETLSLSRDIKGSGTFKIKDDLILTKKGYSRSRWELPDIFRDVEISHHTKKSFEEDYFDSAKIGQEFVIEENKHIENWALDIIKKGLPYHRTKFEVRIMNILKTLREKFGGKPTILQEEELQGFNSPENFDILMNKARQLCYESDSISIFMLQERFDISFVTGAKVMDQLEEEGLFGGEDGEWEYD